MKATIDFDEALYRRLKIEAARRGRTIRELVDEGVRRVLGLETGAESVHDEQPDGDWIGSLRQYAGNARGEHGMEAVRRSIARGRAEGA